MTRLEAFRKAVLAEVTPFRKFLILAAAVGISTGLRAVLFTSGQNTSPFVTYYPAILLVAVFAGWQWGAAATIISAFVVDRWFMPAEWHRSDLFEAAAIVIFGIACTMIVMTGDLLRRTIRQMHALTQHNELLTREMHHRIQNVFTVVAAIIRMAEPCDDVAEFKDRLTGRIHALSRANRILHEGTANGNAVYDLIRQTIAPFGRDDAFVLEGTSHCLSPEAGHHLVLVLHELCTNALKHGALSVPQGRVTISWRDDNGALRLDWMESAGPPVRPPARKGLGTRLLHGQNSFEADLRFDADGVKCCLRERDAGPADPAPVIG